MKDELRQKLERYIENAGPSFESINALDEKGYKVKDTAQRYYSDALHFIKKGEFVNAFAALEYAEGWLDAGIAMGVVKAKGKCSEDI